ncbi:MAG: Gfo/Idh/MocA family oxidoreductase [Kineosporiaceae bacterium]|nr:Gfo/Idh/MocA family oxidoreductase [Kineosporiaceae bacterium]MBK8074261.1 Gfo/Idh/MocA family oxidoreductase [Kineosporiaceae bacterium]
MTDPSHENGTDHADRPLRWGVLGTGGIARSFIREVGALDDARVVAVGSRTTERAEQVAAELGVPAAHGSLQALVTDPAVDAVYVATPHPAHAEGALAAIGAGKHVLVEKPFTMNAAEARQVATAARDAGVFCLEAMWTRFLPHAVRIRELIADGALGEIRTVVADHGQGFAADPAHRLYDPALGGGAVLDLGIYPLSWVVMVLGVPTAVTAVADPAMTGVDATTSAVLRYPNGAHAVITTTLTARTACRTFITGTAGTIDVEPIFYAPTGFTLTRREGSSEHFETPALAGPGKGLRFEAAEVARCVRAGLTESPVLPLDETIAIMELVDEIHRQIGRSGLTG